MDVLKDHEAVKQLGSILKTNVRACKALGHPYVLQLGRLCVGNTLDKAFSNSQFQDLLGHAERVQSDE